MCNKGRGCLAANAKRPCKDNESLHSGEWRTINNIQIYNNLKV